MDNEQKKERKHRAAARAIKEGYGRSMIRRWDRKPTGATAFRRSR